MHNNMYYRMLLRTGVYDKYKHREPFAQAAALPHNAKCSSARPTLCRYILRNRHKIKLIEIENFQHSCTRFNKLNLR